MGVDLPLGEQGRLTKTIPNLLPSTKDVIEGLLLEVVDGVINPNYSESRSGH